MMKIWIALVLVAIAAEASAQTCASSCDTMKWATCESNPCRCEVFVGDNKTQQLDCTKLIPKCFLMKAEMYRRSKGQAEGKGIYDPECENDGKFKAKQCNINAECWCVNSAGVRRTDKGDKDLKCEKLVEAYSVRLVLKHKPVNGQVNTANLKADIADAIHKRYQNFNKDLVKNVKYEAKEREIVVDVEKEKGNRNIDLTHMAYYMEKDVKVLPLFKNQEKFEPTVGSQKLEMESIQVSYVDEEPPTITTRHLSGGIISIIVVVVLIVVAGLLIVAKAIYNKRGK